MSSVIQSATSAVASLPALIIQRADPGLYNLLTNGVLQARLDFDRSKLTCKAMANRMADTAGGQAGWDQLAEGFALRDAVSSTDAVSAVEQAESNKGNNGVPWVGGGNAGGSGQGSIKVVGDVTRAGYNLLNSRGVTDTSSIPRASCGNRLTCQTWSSPQAAADFATRVLGEREQRTCRDLHQDADHAWRRPDAGDPEEYETKLQALQELVTGAKPTTVANLEAAGSNSLPITRGVIEAARRARSRPARQAPGLRAALSSVLEKALLLQRTLLTGRRSRTSPPTSWPSRRSIRRTTRWSRRSTTSRPSWSRGARWPAIRRWRSCSATAPAPRARAASSRATRRATGSEVQKPRSGP